MFNHSTQDQNVGWERDLVNGVVTYRTLRDIQEGEELCMDFSTVSLTRRSQDINIKGNLGISYGSRLTFVDTDAPKPVDEGDGSQLLGNIQIDD